MKSGALIVLEGVDRCGKTTQCARLVERLVSEGVPCEALRFPARETAIGKLIDAYLKSSADLSDQAIHLLFSANRWELNASMKEKLENGITLVVDRYTYSGQAFTFAKGGIDLEWCKAPDVGLPTPDVVIFLDLSIEHSMKRGKFGEERYEKEAFQRRVRECFLDMAKDYANLFHVLDAQQSIEDVSQEIWKLCAPLVQKE